MLRTKTRCIKRPMFRDGLALMSDAGCVYGCAPIKHNYCEKALI